MQLLADVKGFIFAWMGAFVVKIFGINPLFLVNLCLQLTALMVTGVEVALSPCSLLKQPILQFMTSTEQAFLISHCIYLFYNNTTSLPRDYYALLCVVGVLCVVYRMGKMIF